MTDFRPAPQITDLPMPEDAPYVGEHVAVRQIQRRAGGVGWAVHRPGQPSVVLDTFPTLQQANAVALYVDARGGSYAAPIRKAAKRFALGLQP